MNTWKVDLHSECGPRDENQDNFLIIGPSGNYIHLEAEERKRGNLASWPTDHIRLAVADGMGGHQLGCEFAEALTTHLLDIEFQTQANELKCVLEALHSKLFDKFFRGKRSPGSTLVFADISPNGLCTIATIGDSRVYLSNAKSENFSEAEQLSHDHTEAEFAWRAGIISDEELEELKAEGQSSIVQAMGFGHISIQASTNEHIPFTKQHKPSLDLLLDGVHKDVFQLSLKKGQCLTLASDGWWNAESEDNSTMLRLTRHR